MLFNPVEEKNPDPGMPLGKSSPYYSDYNPSLLYPISRAIKRSEIHIDPNHLPFFGFDYWNHYEVSWLNLKGKPCVATAEILYSCHSPMIVESKSLKLYFNSLNNTSFNSVESLTSIIQNDLENTIQHPVSVHIMLLKDIRQVKLTQHFSGICLDELDIHCDEYTVNPQLLLTHDEKAEETLYSDLLKSNCLVTDQPDWSSIQIQYQGKKIDHASLLRYLVSYRNHREFHEQCIERIFIDILQYCQPSILTVYGRYSRRGGIDINPYRSTENTNPSEKNIRLIRQ